MQDKVVYSYIRGPIEVRQHSKKRIEEMLIRDGLKVESWFQEALGTRRKFADLKKYIDLCDLLVVNQLEDLVSTTAQGMDFFELVKRKNVHIWVLEPEIYIDWEQESGDIIWRFIEVLDSLPDSSRNVRKRKSEEARRKGIVGAPRIIDPNLKERIFKLRENGHSFRKIATEVGVSYGTVQGLFKEDSTMT